MPATILIGGDLEVRRLGFGAMRVTGPKILGWPDDRENALRVLRRAVELGVDLIDTADSYGPEVSELLIADALHPYPDGLVIATKGGLRRTESERGRATAAQSTCGACEEPEPPAPRSHRPLPAARRRSERSVRGERRRARPAPSGGQDPPCRPVERERRATQGAQELVPVVSVQNRYSLADRAHEDVLDECERQGIAFFPGTHSRPATSHRPEARSGE